MSLRISSRLKIFGPSLNNMFMPVGINFSQKIYLMRNQPSCCRGSQTCCEENNDRIMTNIFFGYPCRCHSCCQIYCQYIILYYSVFWCKYTQDMINMYEHISFSPKMSRLAIFIQISTSVVHQNRVESELKNQVLYTEY